MCLYNRRLSTYMVHFMYTIDIGANNSSNRETKGIKMNKFCTRITLTVCFIYLCGLDSRRYIKGNTASPYIRRMHNFRVNMISDNDIIKYKFSPLLSTSFEFLWFRMKSCRIQNGSDSVNTWTLAQWNIMANALRIPVGWIGYWVSLEF